MKVKELIQKLNQFDPELDLVTNGYEFGFEDLCEDNIYEIEIHLNVNNNHYSGNHEIVPSLNHLDEDERKNPECVEYIQEKTIQRDKHYKRKKVINIGRY